MSVSERISPSQVTESVNTGQPVGLSVAKEEATTTNDSASRAPSPDPSCSICLDNVTDAAFTDRCCHRFCFNCLLSWSRVKPECPLCKVRFSFIIHNVRSLGDYDEMPVTWAEPPSPTVDANFLISVAFDRPRFRYRTTGSGPRDFSFQNVLGVSSTPLSSNPLLAGSSMVPNPMATSVANSVFVPHSTSSMVHPVYPSMEGPVYPSMIPTPSPGNTMALEWRRRRQVSASEFRRNVYAQNQWVMPPDSRPGIPYRIRESSPSFYRNNPAQVNRLIPWLHRELLVLFDGNDYQDVCQWVIQAITIFPIRSSRFQTFVRPFLRERTDHFCHEFYHFAISPYDSLAAYDVRTEYRSQSLDYTDPDLSDQNSSDSSDVEIIETPLEVIEISDNENDGVVRVEDADSDASVQIISSLPALADRSPEIIDLLNDSESDVCTVNSSKQNQTVSCSKPGRSSSPEEMDRAWPVTKRLRTRHQPYYKDDSFSSDEDVPRGKKRKIADPPKKRWRKVTTSSSDGDSAADLHWRCKPSSRKKKDSLRKSKRVLSKPTCELSSSGSEDKYKSSTSKSSSSKRSGSDDRKKEYFRQEEELKQLKTEEGLDTLFSLNLFPPVEKREPEVHTAKWCKYSSPGSFLSSVSDEDALRNSPNSPPSSPSPKPRLKSVVKKMDSNLEAGCSSWSSSHNLRQRKATHYNYVSYLSTSDSDS